MVPAVHALSLFVRWAHVAGMAAILGGALLVWWLGVQRNRANAGVVVEVAERYEWIFWAAIGLQVMTGVGNLGAFGEGLAPPASSWGTKLIVKLVAVLALAVLSVPRTLAVVAMAGDRRPHPGLLSALYGGTAAIVIGIAGLAVWLAHG
jgi:uncharacterized membrane protein